MSSTNILFTFQSCADVNDIWEAIATPRSPYTAYDPSRLTAAEQFAEQFEKICELLPRHPEVGSHRDDLNPGVCSVLIQRYVMFYRRRGNSVEVLRILRAGIDVDAGESA
jgi:plasmid stabilization system protein ParE